VNRTLLAAAGGLPLERDLQTAMAKVNRALGRKMKTYLDRLSAVLTLKPEPRHRPGAEGSPVAVEDLVTATIDHRRIDMEYHSFASGRVKSYSIEPYRLTFGNGGLYLFAYVPAYGQMRTFAVQRIRSLTVSDQTFSPVQEVSGGPYDDSLGFFSGGKPETLEIEFSPAVAPYIEEREWHRTQAISRRPNGSIVLKMRVAIDLPLRSWILGFGHQARVLKPSSLAETILDELEEAREQYAPRMEFELPPAIYEDRRQRRLPFRSLRARRPAERRQPGTSTGA
jgi:predicted DNA-binding transcriptional regulator YafY